MRTQALRLPKIDHRPLHSLPELVLTLPRVQRLLLPDHLSKPTDPWLTAATVGLIALIMGWRLLLEPGFQEPRVRWIVIAAIGALAGASIWWMERQRLSVGGWLLDFAQGTVVRVGHGSEETIAIDPSEHSLGCYVAGGSSGAPSFALELRHVRRGPIAQLSIVPLKGHGQTFEGEREQLDLCVDLLAQRLGIRRSGEPLKKASHRRSAS